MKQKDITYLVLQQLIKNKDKAVTGYIENWLNKLQTMFIYRGVPETLDIDKIEYFLKINGHVLFAEVNGQLYGLTGNLGGELNAYYEPINYIVANPYLQLNKTYTIGENCVLMKNDYLHTGLMPLLGRYAVCLTDSEISLNTASILSRITMLISAPDDNTKASADQFLNKIANGDFSVIGENAFFDGVRLQTAPTSNTNYITQLIELVQYYKASFYNEIGLNANYNLKRERLTVNEIEVNVDAILPLVDNMFMERKKALEQINSMFGTNITVDLGSAWKTIHEEEEALNATVTTDSDTHEVNDTVTTDSDAHEVNDTNEENK